MERTGIITRDLKKQNHHWLNKNILKDTKVTEFDGCTYGCVSNKGVAVVLPDTDYFIEVPCDSVKWD